MAECPQRNPQHNHDDVFEHTIAVVTAIKPKLPLRLAALLHDAGKPATRTTLAGVDHFYHHEDVGAILASEVMARLRFPAAIAGRVEALVQHHMFRFDAAASDAAVRRFITRVGADVVPDLLALRAADVEGSGEADFGDSSDRVRRVMAAQPALTLRALAIDGRDVMALGFRGPAVGAALQRCLGAVLDDPARNTRETLLALISSC